MAAALEHLARNHGIPTTYVDLTHNARAKRVRTANAARSKKRARQEMEETDGPPDKHKDFKKGTHTLTSNSRKHLVILHQCADETITSACSCVSPAKKQQKKSTPASGSDNEFTQKSPSARKQGGLTIAKVRLSAEEVSMIEKGNCLQDVHIALANTLLQQQFPDRAGFQSTLYVAKGRCVPQKEGTIQIHFDEARKHWLTSSFSGRRVQIFDSRYTGFIPDGVKEQMKAIYGHLSKQLSAQVVRVQQQQGTTDCGLYAIAYALHVANGDDPAKLKFEQKKMRAHFLECLKKKKLEAFPVEKTISRVARPEIIPL